MKKTFRMYERTFICYVHSEFSGLMGAVNIFEVVRPKWKIFRTKFCDYRTFWLSDYDSIEAGVKSCIRGYVKEEIEQSTINDKWIDFQNSKDW